MSAGAVLMLLGDDPRALDALVGPVRRRLTRARWTQRLAEPFIRVFAPPDARLELSPAFDGHGVLVGEVFDQGGRRLGRDERRSLASRPMGPDAAKAVVSAVWGRYLLVRRGSEGAAVLRDPSGAVEAVAWRKRGVTVITSVADAALDPLMPDDLSLDWASIAAMARQSGEFRHELALPPLLPVAPGELLRLSPQGAFSWQIWRPAAIYRSRGATPGAEAIRDTVMTVVQALAGEDRWIAEVSGGLDSAVVAASLSDAQRTRVAAWVNHYVDDPEGDERGHARAVVAGFGAGLTEVRRSGLDLDEAVFDRAACAFRPSLNDLDPAYNDDIAQRITWANADGSLTGQGGDAVFFQMATPLIALDEMLERGRRARPGAIHRVASWTRTSAWPHVLLRAWRRHRAERRGWSHPWLDDLGGVPPAKALQISALAYCQAFQAPAVRSRAGACVNPLLSQPIMELGLAMSSVDLTWGGRDRAAVRAAFHDRLPAGLIARRSKGELSAFYGRAVAANLAFLRDYILGGALAEAGCIDQAAWSERLTPDRLLWKGGHGAILSLALTEAWARHWRARLASRRPD